MKKAPPAGVKDSSIVFPAACAWEKRFAGSERGIVRLWRTTEAQSEAKAYAKKWPRHFFDTLKRALRARSSYERKPVSMLFPITDKNGISAFVQACAFERVFGSKALTALRAYGLSAPNARFYLCEKDGSPSAALYLAGGVLAVSASGEADPDEIADLIRWENAVEVDTHWELCEALRKRLGGRTESSYFMVYQGEPPESACPGISTGRLPEVFDVLRQSHEYYRSHLEYGAWSSEWTRRLSLGLSELYQVERDGKIVATGSIASEDETCGVIAAVAVLPAWRRQGLGSEISRFLVRKILDNGKTPRLIAGYDAVAELYRKVGFVPCGRWGELYLT